MKSIFILFISILFLLTSNGSFAEDMPGDVKFSIAASPGQHPFQFRLIIDGVTTLSTACITPNTGFAEILPKGAIVKPGIAPLRREVETIYTEKKDYVEARDCSPSSPSPDKWIRLGGRFSSYNSGIAYNLVCNLNSHTCDY